MNDNERDRRAAMFPEMLKALQRAEAMLLDAYADPDERHPDNWDEEQRVIAECRSLIAKAKGGAS